MAENVAARFRDDPLQAEAAFRDMVFGVARSVLAVAFETLDDHGAALVPAESVLGLTVGGLTPEADFSMCLTVGLTARESEGPAPWNPQTGFL